jgi:hypothetical protein
MFETRLPFHLHDGDVTEGSNLIRRVQEVQPTKTPGIHVRPMIGWLF